MYRASTSRLGLLASAATMVVLGVAMPAATARPLVPTHAASASDVQLVKASKYAKTSKKKARRIAEARRKARAERRAARLARIRAAGSPAAQTATAETAPKTILTRAEILASDPAVLERIGRHVMIGYHRVSDVEALLERRAIAGVFITDHNVRRRKAEDIRAEIDRFQAIRANQGLPPLVIAADQEGGAVSRLSPPLKSQPALGRVLRRAKDETTLKAAVEDYALLQARELKRLGVTLNFSPVVDLRLDPRRRTDGETLLRFRAISPDPILVARIAGWYCAALATEDLSCTLKHFPGLGRVKVDTHRRPGSIDAAASELLSRDWRPFTELMHRPTVATMLAHVTLPAIDPDHAASYSKPVIDGLIRRDMALKGVLITDDLSMGAVRRSTDGLWRAPAKSLNAGADLLLVSYSERDLDTVMSGLIEAAKAGEIDGAVREASRTRLDRFIGAPQPRALSAPSVSAPANSPRADLPTSGPTPH
ncbi:MAG: glycoside hydrolase family 3 N-terminal domain-containing protein [Hyphomicrobium sp.]|nr:glycoside hydrolase family 3 N-terminal domain-containing protein [Hyphomicrobium sp.]